MEHLVAHSFLVVAALGGQSIASRLFVSSGWLLHFNAAHLDVLCRLVELLPDVATFFDSAKAFHAASVPRCLEVRIPGVAINVCSLGRRIMRTIFALGHKCCSLLLLCLALSNIATCSTPAISASASGRTLRRRSWPRTFQLGCCHKA